MKRYPFGSLLRWRDRRPDGQSPEDRAAALVRSALVPEALPAGLDDRELAEVERSVRARLATPRSRPSLRLRLALAGFVLIAGVASVMAYQMGWLAPRRATRAAAPGRASVPESKRRTVARGAPELSDRAAMPEAAALAHDEPTPAEAPRLRLPRANYRKAAGSAPESTSATSDEILALNRAVALLRGKHDAQAALEALDDYFGRFPAGMLNREARVARIDALLVLHRSEEALHALDSLPLDAHGRSTELRLIRGELRSTDDCARAEVDFAAVLARAESGEFAERALYGLGTCRLKRGDNPGAAETLRRYLARFPDGSHASWARRWLTNLMKDSRP